MINNTSTKPKKDLSIKKRFFTKKTNAPLFSRFEKFDPETGEKIADDVADRRLAVMEAKSEAMGKRTAPVNYEETLKDSATGGSLAFLVSHTPIKNMRLKGAIGLASAIGAGALSLRKQRGEYNRQQGARELLAGKKTGRASAYKDYLVDKYKIQKGKQDA
jgi:hypothetical protein